MNDPVIFWAAFWQGVGAGFLFCVALSAVLTVIYLIGVVDNTVDDEQVADKLEPQTNVRAMRGKR